MTGWLRTSARQGYSSAATAASPKKKSSRSTSPCADPACPSPAAALAPPSSSAKTVRASRIRTPSAPASWISSWLSAPRTEEQRLPSDRLGAFLECRELRLAERREILRQRDVLLELP